ncbi:MAG: hypothetical protein JWP38_1335 [Herbaspirillum sp.]|nr:hypothetical protein [Herbaspirillum sp.]
MRNGTPRSSYTSSRRGAVVPRKPPLKRLPDWRNPTLNEHSGLRKAAVQYARLTRRPNSILLPEFFQTRRRNTFLSQTATSTPGKPASICFSNPYPERRNPHDSTFVRTTILFFSSDSRRPVILVNKKDFYANFAFHNPTKIIPGEGQIAATATSRRKSAARSQVAV